MNSKPIVVIVIVFLSAFLLVIMNVSIEATSFTAVVTRLKETEREGGATADGIRGGGTYYYAYFDCGDKNIVKFRITEQLYNTYPTDSSAEIKVKQKLCEKIFSSDEERNNPQNYQYFIDDTEIMYSYRMTDDKIID